MQILLTFTCVIYYPWMLIWAAFSDIRSMTISNRHNAIFLCSFIPIALLLYNYNYNLNSHLVSFLFGLALGFILFIKNWMGGGDVKLIAAVGAWLGVSNFIDFLIAMAIWGGVLTIAIILIRKLPVPKYFSNKEWYMRLYNKESGIPYGVAIAIAAIQVWPNAEVFKKLLTLYS